MWVGGVRVVIPNEEENKVLMVCQHHEEKDIWMVPGGGIEAGESSIDAAIRETKEETGLDIENPVLCGIIFKQLLKLNAKAVEKLN